MTAKRAVLCTLFALVIPLTGAGSLAEEPPIVAAVWEHRDTRSGATGAVRLLEEAGAEVLELSRASDPGQLRADMIVLGSFVSEAPGYARWMREHAEDLARFVEEGGLLVQFAQESAREPSPPFLPEGLVAERRDRKYLVLRAAEPGGGLIDALAFDVRGTRRLPLPGHPLKALSWDAFREHAGFRVDLWSDEQVPYGEAALLEASHGRGRFILASLLLDKLFDARGRLIVDEPFAFAARHVFARLVGRAAALRARPLPPVKPSAPDWPEPLPFVPGSSTIVLLPDTQLAVQDIPEAFYAQTRWIVDQRDERDIAFVVHLGDVVHQDRSEQWRVAERGMRILEKGGVPYSVLPGNHDYSQGMRADKRLTRLSEHFPPERFEDLESFGGVFEEGVIDNSYHLFSAGGRDWIVISLEWWPRREAVRWASEILARHPERDALIATHAYLDNDDTRIDRRGRTPGKAALEGFPESVLDGEDLWRELVSRHPNVRLVVSGHVTGDGCGRLTSAGAEGLPVHQMLSDYQVRVDGGEGYLRLLELLPDGRTLQVKTYSPWLDRSFTGPEHQFTLELPPPRQ